MRKGFIKFDSFSQYEIDLDAQCITFKRHIYFLREVNAIVILIQNTLYTCAKSLYKDYMISF